MKNYTTRISINATTESVIVIEIAGEVTREEEVISLDKITKRLSITLNDGNIGIMELLEKYREHAYKLDASTLEVKFGNIEDITESYMVNNITCETVGEKNRIKNICLISKTAYDEWVISDSLLKVNEKLVPEEYTVKGLDSTIRKFINTTIGLIEVKTNEEGRYLKFENNGYLIPGKADKMLKVVDVDNTKVVLDSNNAFIGNVTEIKPIEYFEDIIVCRNIDNGIIEVMSLDGKLIGYIVYENACTIIKNLDEIIAVNNGFYLTEASKEEATAKLLDLTFKNIQCDPIRVLPREVSKPIIEKVMNYGFDDYAREEAKRAFAINRTPIIESSSGIFEKITNMIKTEDESTSYTLVEGGMTVRVSKNVINIARVTLKSMYNGRELSFNVYTNKDIDTQIYSVRKLMDASGITNPEGYLYRVCSNLVNIVKLTLTDFGSYQLDKDLGYYIKMKGFIPGYNNSIAILDSNNKDLLEMKITKNDRLSNTLDFVYKIEKSELY